MRRFFGLILTFLLAFQYSWSQKTFQTRVYYDDLNTRLKEVITMTSKDSILHGPYNSIYENGSLAVKGFYYLGKTDSSWTYYYENGRIKVEGSFDKGVQNGNWKYYYENGRLKARGNYQSAIKHGSWNYYYENGKYKSAGIYYKDIKEGIWNYFYEDGSIRAQAFYSNGRGQYKEFYPGGKLKCEGQNINDKSEGTWTYYHEDNNLQAIGEYKNGLKNGNWQYYHSNGQISAEGTYLDGEKTGGWKYYFEDGTLSSEGEMNNDQQDGFWKLYYPSGELKGEGVYDQGTGDYVEYYPSGQPKARGAMMNGLKQGKWLYFNEQGKMDGQADFVDGEGHYEEYYPDGTIKMNGKIKNSRKVGQWTLYNPDGTVAGIYKPVYEDEKPIFRTSTISEPTERRRSEKPEYKYKNNKLRYFNPRINEYTGFIIGTNPLMPPFGQVPISVEYYLQERLGHEMNIVMTKKPFYSIGSATKSSPKTLGIDLHMRQKFYHDDSKLGMFYFGHELLIGHQQHNRTITDALASPPSEIKLIAKENRIAYGLIIGDRWTQRTGDSGMTIDMNMGIAIGTRVFKKEFDSQYFHLFNEINQDRFYLPLILTINLGYIGPKNKGRFSNF